MATVESTNGVTIAYDVIGEGPPLVLVHGITQSARTWDPLMDALQAAHRVVRLDLRGHGASSNGARYEPADFAADVHAVVSEEGLVEPLLVGHSLGGIVVTAYASTYGGCRGVVNVDQTLQLGGLKDMLGQIEPLLRADAETFRATIDAVFATLDGPLHADERARVAATSRPDQDVVLGVWSIMFDSTADQLNATVESLVGSITAPYLSLHGVDPGVEYGNWLTAKVPTATVEVWPDHGHYPHLVDRNRFVDRLAAFEAGLGSTPV